MSVRVLAVVGGVQLDCLPRRPTIVASTLRGPRPVLSLSIMDAPVG